MKTLTPKDACHALDALPKGSVVVVAYECRLYESGYKYAAYQKSSNDLWYGGAIPDLGLTSQEVMEDALQVNSFLSFSTPKS